MITSYSAKMAFIPVEPSGKLLPVCLIGAPPINEGMTTASWAGSPFRPIKEVWAGDLSELGRTPDRGPGGLFLMGTVAGGEWGRRW